MEILRALFERVASATQGSPGDVKRFAWALIQYCDAANASVTSYYRTQKRNARVGGAQKSRHMRGLAADVVYDEPLGRAHRETIATQFGLELLHEGDHDHVQIKRI